MRVTTDVWQKDKEKREYVSLVRFVESEIYSYQTERTGCVFNLDLERTVENLIDSYAKLVDVLANKGILTQEDIQDIFKSYSFELSE